MDGLSRVVVWDVDDVLNDLMRTWFADVWAPAHPDREVRYEDLRANPPCDVLGLSLPDYLTSLDGFRLGAGYAGLEPNREILAWLRDHGETCHHVALTSTAFRAAPTSASWVLRHFGRWIREFAFIPAPRAGEDLPTYDVDKGAWLARVGMRSLLVDDSAHNVAAVTAAGASALCWPQPWNAVTDSAEDTLGALTRWLADPETV